MSNGVYKKIMLAWVTLLLCLVGTTNAIAKPLTLDLDEAIILAVRDNPNIQAIHLQYAVDKFGLFVQEWQFYPHFGFQASAGFNRSKVSGAPYLNNTNNSISPSITWNTPIGTQATLTSTNNGKGQFHPGLSLSISQPLLRGFGQPIVENALNNARDSFYISKLNIENSIRSTVTSVINAYLDVVTAQKTVNIDLDALKRAEQSVEQTRLFIKAGRKAGNELVTVQATVAGAKSQLESDRNNLSQNRYALLTAIGIDPNSPIIFKDLDIPKLIAKYHLPNLADVKRLTLEKDLQYQTDLITLHGQTKRSLMVAKDNTRWQLNLNANLTTGNGIGPGFNSGLNSLINGQNLYQYAGLTLTIPIDDQQAKQQLMSAKVAVEKAEIALTTERWNKETTAINNLNLLQSALRSLHFSEDAERLQEKTYHISNQKYLHGLIDSLEWQSAQFQLIQAQQSLLNAQISYLKALVNLDALIGHTLTTWHIKVRV